MPDALSNRRRKEISALAQRKYRKRYGQTLLEGRRAVASALDAGAPLVDLVVSEAARHEPEVVDLIEQASVPVYTAPDDVMNQLSDVQTSQGVLAVVRRVYETTDELAASLDTSSAVVVLDRVQNPGNAGTIMRTAAWFGADAVVAGPGTVGLYGPKVLRAAMGAHWDLRIARSDDLGGTLYTLRQHGAALYGADLTGLRAADWQPARPSVLVLGSEAHGLSPGVQDVLDATVALPGAARRRGTESLNVAVAAGILVYEWLGRG